jgi:cephalosporin-C deacetylase-like acetyl esterase
MICHYRVPLRLLVLGLVGLYSPCTLLGSETTNVRTAEGSSVFSPEDEPGDMLRAYLLTQCDQFLDARREEVRQLETPEAVHGRMERIRRSWLAAIGPFPERTPLNAKTVGVLPRDGYQIERVYYESRPGHHVTANLYLPEGPGPFPAVLVPCGHSQNGKAAEAYQRVCILMARHGFVVLIYDPIGQGERFQLLDEAGKPVIRGTTEHTLTDIGARLTGVSTANYRIWDGIRSIDYLVSRPEVDPDRIGCTGNSGGGTLTSYLMATDERIAVAAPSCYITSLSNLFHTIGPQDGEQNITGQVALGIDHADYINLRAPKPTLVLTATRDFFDIDGSWDSFREAKRLYGILGFGERVELFEYPDQHGFSQPRREAALRWMRRWLQGINDAARETETEVQDDEALQVTESGQVVTEFRGRTVWDLNLERARELRPIREAWQRDTTREDVLAEIRRLVGIRSTSDQPQVKRISREDRDQHRLDKILIKRGDAPPVPALFFQPIGRETATPTILYVDGRGKAQAARRGGPIEALVSRGHAVLAIDLRGTGETAPTNTRSMAHNEFPISYLGIHLGRPLLGQRTEDVLAAIDVLHTWAEVPTDSLRLVGVERGGPVALHAAALDSRISEVTVEKSIESWLDVVATPLGEQQLEQIVPGALERYDLPDLVRMIHPRTVEVRDSYTPTGVPKNERQAQRDTEATFEYAYEKVLDYYVIEAWRGLDEPVPAYTGEMVMRHTQLVGQRPWVMPTPSANEDMVLGTTPGWPKSPAYPDDPEIPPQDIYGYQITDPNAEGPKVKMILAAGNHSTEFTGNWVLEGMVNFLAGNDPRAHFLRRKAVVFVYPDINPEGRYQAVHRINLQAAPDPNAGGNLRKRGNPELYAAGLDDHNRVWTTKGQFSTIDTITAAMRRDTGGSADYLWDMHGPQEPPNWRSPLMEARVNEYALALLKHEPDVLRCGPPGNFKVNVASGPPGKLSLWAASSEGLNVTYPYVYEPGGWTRDRLLDSGRKLVLALYDVLASHDD